MPRWFGTSVLALFIASQLVLAQVLPPLAAPAAKTFEVATVKESGTLDIDGFFNQTPGRFTVTNLELRSIIQYTYRIKEYQLIDVPGWARSTRYHVEATR